MLCNSNIITAKFKAHNKKVWKVVTNNNKLKKAVYVVDTMSDLEGAKYAGIPFIYAKYGFGELDDMKYLINKILDISKIIGSIL